MRGLAILTLALVFACGGEGAESIFEAAPAWRESRLSWTPEDGLVRLGSDGSLASWSHEAEIESTDHHRATSSKTEVEGFGPRFERIEISIAESHPLLGIAAETMVELPSEFPGLRSICYRGSGPPAAEPAITPDLVVRLSAPELREPEMSGRSVRHELDVHCEAAVPVLRRFQTMRPTLTATITLHHASNTRVKESRGLSAPQHREAGKTIGRQFAAAITTSMRDLLEDSGPAIIIPEALLPEPAPTPEIGWPEGTEAKLLSCYRGFRVANETTWDLKTPSGTAEFVRSIVEDLEATGWEVTSNEPPRLFLLRGDEHLQVEEQPWRSLPGGRIPLTVVYSRDVAKEAQEVALRGIDWYEVDPAFLLHGIDWVSEELGREILAHLERSPLTSWRDYGRLATWQERWGRDETEVRRTAAKAAMRAHLENACDELEKRWPERVKDWGLDRRPLAGPTAGEMLEEGASEIAPGASDTFEIDFDEPLRFVMRGEAELVGFEFLGGLGRHGRLDEGYAQLAQRRDSGNSMTNTGISRLGMDPDGLRRGRPRPVHASDLDMKGLAGRRRIEVQLVPGEPPRLRVTVTRSD